MEDLVLMLILSLVLPPAILVAVERLRERRKDIPA
jgi:hypothetical protein